MILSLTLLVLISAVASDAVLIPRFVAISLVSSLTKQQAQFIGFLYSGLAILTQFLPPLLDVLGITITTK
ncbi:MAG TPA: hypothetical protein VGP82_11315 [Ktedonobacterales bacterium]|jgi:hypothetical protein|nr:hypothetical protein [Ktedonobacterales bacterium]